MRANVFIVAGLLAIGCSEPPRMVDPGPGPVITPPTPTPDPGSGGTIVPPTPAFMISSIAPKVASTLGREQVTITGTGFDQRVVVSFGGIAAEIDGTQLTPTRIVAYTPANPGAWGVPIVVSVRRSDGATLVNNNTAGSPTSFRYYASTLDFRQRDFWNVNSGAFRGYRFGLWGDFNNDGLQDLVITYANTANYSVFRNNGGGNLTNTENTNFGPNNPASFWSKITNLDNDGIPDVMTIDEGSTWDYRLGTSNVRLDQRGSQGAGGQYNGRSIDFAQVNNDAYNDMIAAAFAQQYVALLYNQYPNNNNLNAIFTPGAPNKTLNTPGANPYHAVFTDLNRDGRMDVVAFSSNNVASLFWFIAANNDLPSTATGSVGTNSGHDVFVGNCADLNNDSYPDCATADYSRNTVRIFLNNGAGTLLDTNAAQTIPVGTQPRGLIFDDINGDGNLDLIVTNVNSHNFTVVPGRGDGTFGNIMGPGNRILSGQVNIAFNACKYGWSINTVDVDNDGVKEISVSCQTWTNDDSYLGGILVYKNVSR